MLRLLAALAAVLLLTAAPGAQQPIRLVVIVVLDQFRADYLNTFASHWRGGIQDAVRRRGSLHSRCIPILPPDTCAGHFTIATGTFPRTHGMVADTWWEATSRRVIECTDDDQSPLVSYGLASKLGKSARHSMAPSFADELRGQKRGARVVTLSMKARSAIGLAGHGGDAVTWFEEGAGVGSFVTSRAYSPVALRPCGRFSLAIRSKPTSGSSGCCASPGNVSQR